MNETKQLWPSWRYGPKGEAQIFDREEDVPKGWKDHPSKFGKKAEDEVAVPDASGNVSTEDGMVAPVSASSKPKHNKGKGKGKKAEKKKEVADMPPSELSEPATETTEPVEETTTLEEKNEAIEPPENA